MSFPIQNFVTTSKSVENEQYQYPLYATLVSKE